MRILVVEDERLLCDGIAEDLRLEKYTVDCCYDGPAACERLFVEPYDLVVLDLNLPGMDGLELLRHIRTEQPELRVLINENYAVFAPNSRSMQEQQEEKIYGRMTPEQAEELYKILETKVGTEEEPKEDVAKQLRRFMRKHHLPFLATDRSVLNLPAIGKSMTFQLVGLTEEGKRILRFEHDGTRHHSPIIDQMGQIYIVENKSLAAYLRQLAKMGEDPEDYASIWNYTKGETEPRFSLYEYPDFPFRTTDKMSNLSIKD